MSCQYLPNECIQQILKHFKRKNLFPLLLINRHWCRNVVKFLYANPFSRSHSLIIRTYISCLNETELQYLSQQIILPTLSKPLFDYAIFLEEFNYRSFGNRVRDWILQSYGYYGYYFTEEDNKVLSKGVVELSTILLKLIMRSGINLKTFKFKIEKYLFIPDVKECFTIQPGLSNLKKFEGLSSSINDKIPQLFKLIPSICENIEVLTLYLSDEITSDTLSDIIKSQKCLLEIKLVNLPMKDFELLKKHENSLKGLSLICVNFKETTTKNECLPKFKHLENLFLSRCEGINLEQLKIIFGNNSNCIKQLGLFVSWPDQLQSELFRIIGSSLQSLALNNFSTEIIESIIRYCPNITELTISNDKIPLIISLVSEYSLKYLMLGLTVHIDESDLENLGKNIPHTIECLILSLKDYKDLNLEKFFENCKANLKVLILKNFYHLSKLNIDAIIKYVEERRSLRIFGVGTANQKSKEYQLLEEKYNVNLIQDEELVEWIKLNIWPL